MKKAIALIILMSIGGRLFASPLNDMPASADSATTERIPVYLEKPVEERSINWLHLSVFTATTFGFVGTSVSRMDDWWGHSQGAAHIKHDDWNGDGLLQTDEISHMFICYKVAQAGTHFARWSGFSDGTSRWIGGGLSIAILGFVEYPIDTYNPIQGFGYTDMAANVVGTGLALARDRWPEKLGFFDLRISVKDFSAMNSELIAQSFAQNDAFIYWLTMSPAREFPVHAAIGHSANHDSHDNEAEREVYIGFGTSLGELAGLIDRRWQQRLDFWSIYELSFSFRID